MSISYCGINCNKCPVYIATINDSDELKEKVASEWGVFYKRDFEISDINCLGCKSDTRFHLCSSCDIEQCNVERQNESCHDCGNYPCERISKFEKYLKKKDLYYR